MSTDKCAAVYSNTLNTGWYWPLHWPGFLPSKDARLNCFFVLTVFLLAVP